MIHATNTARFGDLDVNPGWIYILVNSAMPGLVKVGKTTRDPAERANELSNPTGIPTPFVVAFCRRVNDCDAVESHFHVVLTDKGLREVRNREFFRAEPTEVIDHLIEFLTEHPRFTDAPTAAAVLGESAHEEFLHRLSYGDRPWSPLLRLAEELYSFEDGVSESLKDGDGLDLRSCYLELFKSAAQLGSPLAFERLGDIYRLGHGVCENKQESYVYYHQGVNLGNNLCFAGIARLRLLESDYSAANKSWGRLFKMRRIRASDRPRFDIFDSDDDRLATELAFFLDTMIRNDAALDPIVVEHARPLSFQIKNALDNQPDSFGWPRIRALLKDETSIEQLSSLYRQAYDYFYGVDGKEQDLVRAWNLYQSVFQLGGGEPTYLLGEMSRCGLGRDKDLDHATIYFDCGVEFGLHCCLAGLAVTYSELGNRDEATTCGKRFTEYVATLSSDSKSHYHDLHAMVSYLGNIDITELAVPSTVAAFQQFKPKLVSYIKNIQHHKLRADNDIRVEERALGFINAHL